jgi:hypothetical protein
MGPTDQIARAKWLSHLLCQDCEITCYSGKFGLWANLDTSRGPDIMCGTSAYFYYTHTLEKVTFQVLANATTALGSAAEFRQVSKKRFGRASSRPEDDYGSSLCWWDDHSVLSCSLHRTTTIALLQWMTRDYAKSRNLVSLG